MVGGENDEADAPVMRAGVELGETSAGSTVTPAAGTKLASSGGCIGPAYLTVRQGHSARLVTLWETLPSRKPSTSPRPRLPSTIRSMPFSLA